MFSTDFPETQGTCMWHIMCMSEIRGLEIPDVSCRIKTNFPIREGAKSLPMQIFAALQKIATVAKYILPYNICC